MKQHGVCHAAETHSGHGIAVATPASHLYLFLANVMTSEALELGEPVIR
jgi:hypothetical protein